MGTRPRPRYTSPDRLGELISSALEPLTTEVKEMRKDIGKLELTSVSRTEVYDRGMIDEKLGKLVDEIKALRASIDLYKMLGGAALLVTLYVGLVQHVTLH